MGKPNYDVVVIGGGIAGVASALSAVREKKSVLLVEANYALGGLATLGMVVYYLPLDDGSGRQIAAGIAEELLRLSVRYDRKHPLANDWKEEGKRFESEFNPSLFSLLLEEKLISEGVDILFGTSLIGVKKEGSFISSIELSTRSSRFSLEAKTFIDATGDANLCAYAGEKTSLSTCKNALAYWHFENNALVMNEGFSLQKGLQYDYQGLSPFETSAFVKASHKAILGDFLSQGDEEEGHSLTRIPSIPELRMTRKLEGKYKLSLKDNGLFKKDSVGVFPSWMKKGDAFELPYGALIGTTKNLYAAGRNISSEDDRMWNVVRSIPVCAVSGEAAGLLAATFANNEDIDIEDVHRKMDARGLFYHLKDVKY